jgi:4a-hydroxytetrahydrobiopterin dehydratase
MSLKEKNCVPCRGGVPPMSEREEDVFIAQIPGWTLNRAGTHMIRKELRFESFRAAIGFVNRVAAVAEKQDHHPDIAVHFDAVTLEIYTHKIDGLHENDFILASKINDVVEVS